jgi:hypothetical protein
MRLTIIRDMGLVHIDGRGHDEQDMTGVPENVHALQWNGESGEIEYTSSDVPNEVITSLPAWATPVSSAMYAKLDAEDRAEAKAKEEHEAYLASDQYKKDQAIAEAKDVLANTDWVVVKISEAQALGEDVSALTAKYADVLEKRQTARDTINSNQG